MLRGVADLRILGREAEAAFSIEKPWQSHGAIQYFLSLYPNCSIMPIHH